MNDYRDEIDTCEALTASDMTRVAAWMLIYEFQLNLNRGGWPFQFKGHVLCFVTTRGIDGSRLPDGAREDFDRIVMGKRRAE